MRKLALTVFAAFAVSFACAAQQSLYGGQQIISPEIHEDNTVTFRFQAPKAIRVQVTGDFLEPTKMEVPGFGTFDVPGVADLTEGENGIWEYTTDVLESELYNYNFIVDGLSVKDPNNAYIQRDIANLMNYFIIPGERADNYFVKDVPHGTVSRVWYHSDVLDKDRRLAVYTPAGYETSRQRYPVLYLLHGMGGDEEAWLCTGRAKKAEGRAIAGLSMGGGHSFNISLNYPNTFDYVGLFSAGLGIVQDNGMGQIAPEFYENIDEKIDRLFANDPALYYIAIGETDFLYDSNKDLREKLEAKGYPFVYVETPGGHIWRNWRIYLEDFAQRIFK